jgi:hypothetical protein
MSVTVLHLVSSVLCEWNFSQIFSFFSNQRILRWVMYRNRQLHVGRELCACGLGGGGATGEQMSPLVHTTLTPPFPHLAAVECEEGPSRHCPSPLKGSRGHCELLLTRWLPLSLLSCLPLLRARRQVEPPGTSNCNHPFTATPSILCLPGPV